MKTKVMKTSLVTIIALLLVSACGVLPTRGSRSYIIEDRNVSEFSRLEVSGAGNVTIIQDGTEALRVETDDNVMQYVTSRVNGGTLSIGLEFPGSRSVIPSRLNLTLHVKDLSSISTSGAWNVVAGSFKPVNLDITISGSGKVTINDLSVDKLTADISGSGEMYFAGRANSQDVKISGSGTYNAGDLQTRDTSIEVSGSGKVTAWATTKLDASISGMGSVSYYGSPQVAFNESGSGKIKSLGNK
jgi:hypothetical protein